MSAILQFRRGAVVPTLQIGEPFFDSTKDTLVVGDGTSVITLIKMNESNVGSIILTGDVTAVNGTFSGTVDVTGDLVVGGSIILGDNPADPIQVNGVLSGSLVPTTGSTFNIGAPSTRYSTLYADSLDISGGITADSVAWGNITSVPTLISGSSQIDHDATTNFVASEHIDHATINITAGLGLSGGGTIAATRTLTLDTGSTHFINGVSAIAPTLPSGLVSGSSQLTSSYDSRYELQGSGIWSGSEQLPSGLVSGSSQLTSSYDSRYQLSGSDVGLPSGVVSGSSQIDLTATTNYISGIKTRLNVEGVISGSSQLTTEFDTRYLNTGGDNVLSSSNENFTTFSASVDTRIDALEAGGLTSIVEDTTPQLGGNLDLNSNTISGSGDINFLGSITLSGSAETFTFTDVITISGNANPDFSSVEVANRLAVKAPAYGGSRIGDAYLQTPSLDIGYNPAYTDSGAINFKSGSNQQTVAGMFTNPEGTVFTIKGFDDSIMVVDHTSIDAVSGSDDAESTIANTISFTNTWSYINDQGVQIYPGATTPVAETHFQVLQNRNGAPRMGFYKGFYDGTTYDRIYSILPNGNIEIDNALLVSGSTHILGDISGSGDLVITTNGSTLNSPAIIGFGNFSSGEGARFQFGDAYNVLQNGYGNSQVLRSYHTLVLDGAHDALVAIDYTDTMFSQSTATENIRVLMDEDKRVVFRQRNNTTRTSNWLTFELSGSSNSVFTVGPTGNISAGTTSANQHSLVGSLLVSSSATPALAVSGAIEATGEITAYAASDERLKLNMTPITNALQKVMAIGGYEYEWDETKQHDKKGHDVGVSAQEVQSILPEVVKERDNGYLAVRYEKMVPLLIEAIKEQQKEIEELKRRLDEK